MVCQPRVVRFHQHSAEDRLCEESMLTRPFSLAQDYPECMRAQLGERLPHFTESDFALLRNADMDFYGMNYYTSQYAQNRGTIPLDTDFLGNVNELQENKDGMSIGEKSGVSWLRSTPNLFRKHLTRVYRKYGKPIYVTENGCPCPGEDKMTCEEAVNDDYRVQYFADHLDAIGRSCEDGSDIRGYFAWSLMDNLGMPVHICLEYFISADYNRMVRWIWSSLWRYLH